VMAQRSATSLTEVPAFSDASAIARLSSAERQRRFLTTLSDSLPFSLETLIIPRRHLPAASSKNAACRDHALDGQKRTLSRLQGNKLLVAHDRPVEFIGSELA
jgi:hypothetical protein